jgi:hypothetical protein
MSKNFEIMEMCQPNDDPTINKDNDAAEGNSEASMHDTGDMRRMGKTQQLNVSSFQTDIQITTARSPDTIDSDHSTRLPSWA